MARYRPQKIQGRRRQPWRALQRRRVDRSVHMLAAGISARVSSRSMRCSSAAVADTQFRRCDAGGTSLSVPAEVAVIVGDAAGGGGRGVVRRARKVIVAQFFRFVAASHSTISALADGEYERVRQVAHANAARARRATSS